MNNSTLETLRQLKEWLDAGTITQQEFDTLKRKLLFDDAAPASPPAAPIAPPAAPAPPHVTAPPVEEPLLPPVVDDAGQPQLEPIILEAGGYRPTDAAPAPAPEPEEYFEPEPPRRQPLATVLIVGGVLALLALMAYLLLGNRESERLTSNSITGTDTTAVTVEEGPQADQLELPPAAAPETVYVQPRIPVQPARPDSAATATPTPDPAATSEAAIRSRVTQALTSFYTDLQAPPFNAAQHFAPQVERFYTLQNTSPAAIDDELNRSHFPEFAESEMSYDPATLQIGPVANDGTVLVTFQERARSFRKSRNQYQRTVAQVRARVDQSGKLTYFRQERLLENTFTDPKPAATPPAEPAQE